MKKAFSRLLSMIIVISAMVAVFYAVGAQDCLKVYADSSGTCGDSLTWTFEDSTKTLTIRGTGSMADYSYPNQKPPWAALNIEAEITKIVIEEGVTSIGRAAFVDCPKVNEVSIPGSVTDIGEGAFQYCNALTAIVLPEGVKNIGQSAIAYCNNLKTITVPCTVTKIEEAAFAYNSKLESVIFQKPGKSGQTLEIGNGSFAKINHNPTRLVYDDPLENPIFLYKGETKLEEQYNLEPLTKGTLTWKAPAGTHFNHDGIKFAEWSSNVSMPGSAGNYYLAKDVTIQEPSSGIWTVPEGTVNLCLNGRDITNLGNNIIVVPSGATLNIYDPDGGGQIIAAQPNANGITVEAGGTLNFYEGTIVSCKRGIHVNGGSATIGRKGSNPQLEQDEYGIYAENDAEVNINSGTISGNTSLYAGSDAKVDFGDASSVSNEIYVKGPATVEGDKVMVYAGYYDNAAYEGLKESAAPQRKFADNSDASYIKKVVEVPKKFIVNTDVNDTHQGSIDPYPQFAAYLNEKVTLKITPKSGYMLKELEMTGGVKTELTVDGNITYATFKMPEKSVSATAIFEKAYNINYDIIHGTAANAKTASCEGEEITLEIDPEEAHELAYINPEGVELNKVSDTQYKFTMPAHDVKISAAYLKKENHTFNGEVKEAFIWDVDNRMPSIGGTYVIDADVNMNGYTEYYTDTDLCLHGHKITLGRSISIHDWHSLNIYDETGRGTIQPSDGGVGITVSSGSFNMYGGTIKDFETAVLGSSGKSQINIYKGTISGGKSFVLGIFNALTIGSEDSSPDSIYISGSLEYNSDSPIKLYAGYYNYYAYRNLSFYETEPNRYVVEGRGFVNSDKAGYYKMISKSIFTVKFADGLGNELKSQEVKRGEAATPPEEPSREGYTFSGWDADFSNVTSDLTVTAKWKQNSFKVTFEDGLGNVLDTQTVVSGRPAAAPAEPTRNGYVFSGWDTDFSKVTSNLTVKALWTEEPQEEDTYKVVFVFGFGNGPVVQTVGKGESATEPVKPTVDGFTFDGWDKEFTNVTENLTVTAQWKKNTAGNEHTVVFVDGYSVNPLLTQRVKDGQSANPPEDPTREGYIFEGWDTDFSYVTENLTVIAQWKQNAPAPAETFTVTFVDGLGKTLDAQTVEKGKAATAPEDPTRDGYTFDGWDKDFSSVTSDLTVTAKWKKSTEPTPAPTPAPTPTKVSNVLIAKVTAKGKNSMTISWNKINGAKGYDIYFDRCNGKDGTKGMKKVKTVKAGKTLKWTKKGLKKKTAYKAYVKAYTVKNGKKKYIKTSPLTHAYTSGASKKYSNAKALTVNKKKVTLKKGKTFKIKTKITKVKKSKKLMPKTHVKTVRYMTSNKKVATVSAGGKITAKGKGTCTIVAFAHNGVSKKIKVTVK